jgi:hypothetical protein
MLGLLFGFNARLGRLHYFLSSVALAIAMLVAVKMPVWSVGKGHHETVVGLLIFFALACCLAFWPSGPETGSSQPGPGARRGREEFRDTPRSTPPVPSVRQTVAAARTGFGRRGV